MQNPKLRRNMTWSDFEEAVDKVNGREKEAIGVVSSEDERGPEQQEERLRLEDCSDDEENDKWSAKEQQDPKYVNHESESEAALFVSFEELPPIPTGPPLHRATELGQAKVCWVSKVKSLPSFRISPFSQASSRICQIHRLIEIVQMSSQS